ncbi:MAG: hypothetical protein PHT99_02255 [Methanoregula sp.]|nr:hypothetical protein [Methanoregula sp.]
MGGKQTGQDNDLDAQGSCTATCPSSTGGIRGFFGYLISCCPYTMLAKKILRFLRGETGMPPSQLTNREIHLKSSIRIGYGIMLVGIFCPVFWLSLLAGARGDELMFNAIHSFLVFLFGVGFVIVYRIQLGREFGGANR